MSGDVTESDLHSDDAEAARHALLALFPAVFAKAVLEAQPNDRQDLIRKFAHSPFLDWDTVQRVLGLAASSQAEGAAEAEILLASAKELLRITIAERTEKTKNGISIQYAFRGHVVSSIGHVLNEGVTELFSKRIMHEYIERDPAILGGLERESAEQLFESGPYTIEVRLAEALVAAVGEKLVGKAYFGDIPDLEALMQAVDERWGARTYLRLLQAADRADWQESFRILGEP